MAKNFVMLSTEDVFLMTSLAHPARSLFGQCYELRPTFQLLLQRPDHLALNFGGVSTYTERQVEDAGHPYFVTVLRRSRNSLKRLADLKPNLSYGHMHKETSICQ
ncbi:hypothetical protein Peur_004187 [Populus x canadensis]